MLGEIARQAESGYPEEICGIVIGQRGVPRTFRASRVTNIAGREPLADPSGTLRDARTAYTMDPLEQLRILREADARGWEVVAIYHSHPDHEAYFSRMDRDRALTTSGEPIWPGVGYLVISVIGGRAGNAVMCQWDSRLRDFAVAPVRMPARA
jgi:proteasome lid subunit RPN8/RPN11